MHLTTVKIDKPEEINCILGQTHFIKTGRRRRRIRRFARIDPGRRPRQSGQCGQQACERGHGRLRGTTVKRSSTALVHASTKTPVCPMTGTVVRTTCRSCPFTEKST